MAPAISNAPATAVLRQAVHYHLDNMSYDNALFFAERLSAFESRETKLEFAYLLALCHFRLGDHRSACEVSKPGGYRGQHLGCAYIFAQSCLALEQYRDGISALEDSKNLWCNKSNFGKQTTSQSFQPDAAAVLCLLGKLYWAIDDRKKATASFEEALKANPFMWDAFTTLADMGKRMEVSNIFKPNDVLTRGLIEADGNEAQSESKERPLSNSTEALNKKAMPRAAMSEQDLFNTQYPPPAAFQDGLSLSNVLANNEGRGLAYKLGGSRLRPGHANSVNLPPIDGMETPPSSTAAFDPVAPRNDPFVEPPQAPSRRARTNQSAEPMESQLRSSSSTSRLLSRRREKPLDTEQVSDQASVISRPTTLSASITDRKRTASGHPVATRQAQQQSEDSTAGQRRSARINTYTRPAIGRPNVSSVPMATASTREMKKPRPQISRARPGPSGSNVGRQVSGNRKPMEDTGMDIDQPAEPVKYREVAQPPQPASRQPSDNQTARIEAALKSLLELLQRLGSGYLSLSQFKCQEAVQCFNKLPKSHLDTPWVQAQMGRAHYELTSYAAAAQCFKRVRVLAPTRLADMEVYSTVLWHLRKETELSFLAHELVDTAWDSPEAWCALGNAWSLTLDHEAALRCFKRATQLNPKFAYAYTLQGHEHVLNEEYDKALTAYRHAITADKRHYNAYYGIGRVCEKLGNYEKALVHYRAASFIHPTNAVLIVCLGTIFEKQREVPTALHYYTRATELAPSAPQTRFKKARALLAIGDLRRARDELMVLKDLAPDEARVHFLLGKLYKLMSDKATAVRHFTIALSLDPKASAQIKEAIQSLEDFNEYDTSSME